MKRFLSKIILVCLLALLAPSLAFAQKVQMQFDGNQNLKTARDAFQSGDLGKALVYYNKALDKDNLTTSDEITANNGLCATHMYLESYEMAISRCEISLGLNPNKWETLNNLGISYLGLGDYTKAIFYLEKGLKINRGSKVLAANLEIAVQRQQTEKIRLEIEQEKSAATENEDGQKS